MLNTRDSRDIVPLDRGFLGNEGNSRAIIGRDADDSTGRPGSVLIRMTPERFVVQGGRRLRAALRLADVTETTTEIQQEVALLLAKQEPAETFLYIVRRGHEAEDAAAIDDAVDARFDRDPAMLPIPMLKIDGETVNRVEFFGSGYIVETVAVVAADLLKGGNS